MMKELLMKLIVLSMLMTVFAYAGTYDYSYSPLGKAEERNSTTEDSFMYGDFEKIIRFNALLFDGGTLRADSKEYLGTIAQKVGEFKNSGQRVAVSIIGHTQASTDDPNENAIKSRTYAEKVISWFSREQDHNTSERISEGYAKDVQKLLADQGVDKNMTVLEYRGGQDEAYSDATSEGRDLSNRVMVTLYVYAPDEIDSDGDGVLDKTDACPKTPKGVAVDTKGCPFDTDGDGVYDYLDQCPNTPPSFKVDAVGCPLKATLQLNFATNSYVIDSGSYPKVAAFAEFLKKNSQYKIEISGHTDSIGSDMYNLTLSFLRANAVRKALINEGVDPMRLKATGLGESSPIGNNQTAEGRYTNRRIEVKLYYYYEK
jgi:outer membrane protein OmpA-like peptidoglycan-associated protein